MNKNKLSILLVIIIGLFCSVHIHAQLDRFEFEYPFKESTNAINIDTSGNVWIAHNKSKNELGIIKFNGHQLNPSTFPESSKQTFLSEIVFIGNEILVANDDKIYIFDPSTERSKVLWSLPENCRLDWIYQDDIGTVWLLMTNMVTHAMPVFRYEADGSFQHVFDRVTLPNNTADKLRHGLNDINGKLYMADFENGLSIYNKNGKIEELVVADEKDHLAKKACSVYILDNQNELWRIHGDNIEVFNRDRKRFEEHPIQNYLKIKTPCLNNSGRLILRIIYRDRKNRLWFGGEDSHLYLYEQDTDRLTFFGKELVDNLGGRGGYISSIEEDANGNIWGRKRGGVFKIKEKKSYFEEYAVNTQNENHPLYDGSDHVNRMLDKFGKFGIRATHAYALNEDTDGNIFFVDQRFVFKLDKKTNELQIIPVTTSSSNVNLYTSDKIKILSGWSAAYTLDENHQIIKRAYDFKRLEKVFQQKNGDLWYTGNRDHDYNTLFAKIDPNDLQYRGEYRDPNGNTLSNGSRISSILEDANENLWVTNSDSIYKIDAASGIILNIDPPNTYNGQPINISDKELPRLRYIQDHNLGYFTSSALGIWNTKTNQFRHYVTIKELGGSPIRWSHFENNSVWFTHLNKLSYYDFTTRELIHFAKNEGLDVERAQKLLALKDGRIALGTYNGLYIFHPDSLLHHYKNEIKNTLSTTLRLESYSILHGQSDSVYTTNYYTSDNDVPIELDFDDRMLEMQFSLLNLDQPEAHRFSHWLEGYDHTWSLPIASNMINYTSLPTGDYKLRVRAHTGHGMWSDDILEIPIIVHPAWYRTWWFYLIVLLFLVTAIYSIIQYYYRREKIRNRQEQEQKEALRLKELDELKGRLFTNITHEFRTPLTVIMGMIDNVKNHPKETSLIKRNSKNLLRLVNQLLDLSKAEAKNLNLNNIQSDIVSYLRYLTESFYSMATDKGLRLTFYTEVDELIMDYDEVKIQHIVYNLLSNAIKFTDHDGKVILHISKSQKDQNPYLQIKVQDTGIGIPSSQIPHLFDRFYQADNSSTRKGEGTGIGLTLTQELVELMSGTIGVKSEQSKPNDPHQGVGTEFKICLPISNEASLLPGLDTTLDYTYDKELVHSIADVSNMGDSDISDETPLLLLIEDNKDIIIYIQSILEKEYTIHTAKNGQLGIDKAIDLIPDIILSDVMMPIKDGYEVCETLKQDNRTSHIPILLLTAKATENAKIEGWKHGADGYLTKPFNKTELILRLQQLISTRKQLQLYYTQNTPITEKNVDDEVNTLDTAFIDRLNAIINVHIGDAQFDIAQLSKDAKMSQTQVYRKLKALTGKTPSAYVRKIRLEKGKHLLLNSDMSISEIAYDTGFSDPNYFSRTFQKEFGKSPRDFRK